MGRRGAQRAGVDGLRSSDSETSVAVHYLESSVDTAKQEFSAQVPPILTIDPGDTVVVHTLDARGYLEPPSSTYHSAPQLFNPRRGHCVIGPIAVRGAKPGTALAVRFDSFVPDAFGWTLAGSRDTELNRRLGVLDEVSPTWLLWRLDPEAGIGTCEGGFVVPLTPFLGIVGVAPAADGVYETRPPRAGSGGNIDCRDLVAGSTLVIPVTVEGGYLFVGDGHAAQGNGEVSGTGLECGMTTQLTVDIVAVPELAHLHAITPSGRVTFGFDPDLNEATVQALDDMLLWMMTIFAIDKPLALALASNGVHLNVTQIANGVWGAHATLADDALMVDATRRPGNGRRRAMTDHGHAARGCDIGAAEALVTCGRGRGKA